jgi:hypothetical protein
MPDWLRSPGAFSHAGTLHICIGSAGRRTGGHACRQAGTQSKKIQCLKLVIATGTRELPLRAISRARSICLSVCLSVCRAHVVNVRLVRSPFFKQHLRPALLVPIHRLEAGRCVEAQLEPTAMKIVRQRFHVPATWLPASCRARLGRRAVLDEMVPRPVDVDVHVPAPTNKSVD